MPTDSPLPWKPLLVAAVVGVALGAWSLRQHAGTVPATKSAARGASNAASGPASASGALSTFVGAVGPATAADVDAWLAGAQGQDAALRLASIKALAQAPRDRALPVLSRIAERGMVPTERLAAVDSLESQAQQSGDADDAIHGVLRTITVDGRDDHLSERAQRLLETLDASTGATR
jgi:hypothetical protein